MAHHHHHSETEKALLSTPDLFFYDWNQVLPDIVKKFKPKKVWFVGTGSSYHVALWSQWVCATYTDIQSQACTTWDFLVQRPKYTKQDLIVMISHRGNKGLTAKLLAGLKKQPRILFCAAKAPTGKNPASHVSPKEKSNAHTISLFGAMCAASELISLWMKPSDAKRFKAERWNTGEVFQSFIDHVADNGTWTPTKLQSVNIVGGAYHHPIAMEIALKAREMAHINASGYGVEEILHGPMISLNSKDEVVLLPTLIALKDKAANRLADDRMEELSKRLQNYPRSIGAPRVSLPRFSEEVLGHMASLSEPWIALVYLFWGQWGMLGAAYQRKVNPDVNPLL